MYARGECSAFAGGGGGKRYRTVLRQIGVQDGNQQFHAFRVARLEVDGDQGSGSRLEVVQGQHVFAVESEGLRLVVATTPIF